MQAFGEEALKNEQLLRVGATVGEDPAEYLFFVSQLRLLSKLCFRRHQLNIELLTKTMKLMPFELVLVLMHFYVCNLYFAINSYCRRSSSACNQSWCPRRCAPCWWTFSPTGTLTWTRTAPCLTTARYVQCEGLRCADFARAYILRHSSIANHLIA